jgi:hypothetical protein
MAQSKTISNAQLLYRLFGIFSGKLGPSTQPALLPDRRRIP